MSRILISAAHKSSGKTSVSVGIAAALARRGLSVQPFKKGPDYIDPMWLGRAAGRTCWNLDFHTMDEPDIVSFFERHGAGADLALIEGNKGLYDGVDLEGGDSNAALARLLGTPVVLVIDTRGMTRGIAPLIRGYQEFEPDAPIGGVILNRVAGPRHEGKLRAALERYTDLPVLGTVRRNPEIEIPERHLGLVPTNESAGADATIARLADAVADQVDLDRLLALARTAPPVKSVEEIAIPVPPPAPDVRIGIARDAAFGFYYPDDLEAFAAAGAELVPFDTLRDPGLPDVDGLFIGGGFPEASMAALSANAGMRASIRSALEAGMPAYTECGGTMYLARSLAWRGETHDMVGAVPGDAVMHDRPVGRGYMEIEETGEGLWSLANHNDAPARFPAHEFHYASMENLPDGLSYAYGVRRGFGMDGRRDGIVIGNTTATFLHLRTVGATPWVRRFTDFVRARRAPQ